MSTATRSAMMIVKQNFPHLGLELPERLIADLAEIDRALGNRDALNSDRRSLADAVAAALDAGKDPAGDKTVLAHLAREQMRTMNLDGELDAVAEDRRAHALREHADAIIGSMSEVVDRADATLAEARERIDPLDLTDETRIQGMRPAEMALWGRAREAASHCERATQVWTLLVSACDRTTVPPHRRPLVIADLSLAELVALGHQPAATAAVHAGHRLKLATRENFAQRLARLETDRVDEARRYERDLAEAAGRPFNAGQPIVSRS